MSAAGFPSWVLLEPFVFRRDDDESFPDESEAPIRATGTTSCHATFHIAFSLAEPPRISRLYAQLPVPGFLDRRNFFIFTADENRSSSLKALPPCTEPDMDYTRHNDQLPPRHRRRRATPRLLDVGALGLWCQGDEFVVAEMIAYKPPHRGKAFAAICLLRSCCTSSDGDQLGGMWESMRVKFISADDPEADDLWQICCWYTDAIIPFRQWLCWIDYQRGIIVFCDMSKLPTPTVSYIWLPLDKMPVASSRMGASSFYYRAVSVVDHGRALKFINVTRHDGIFFAALEPGTGFTITCHTLVLGDGSMGWKEDYTVTSGAHFLFIEFGYANKKMWVVTIDMSTKIVESFSLFINGREGLQTDDAELIRLKSATPKPFLPCEFPKFRSSIYQGTGGANPY
uniref:DUF1618 domain-containing protein n=1 Tax=Setaria italica TaxID=4555 RepID=K3YNA4_SETIT